MIFPILKADLNVQVNDKIRLDGLKTFISPDEGAITLYEIEPEASNGYIDVTAKKYLDWVYSTAGEKTVTLRITTDGSPVTTTATVNVLTVASDLLFSTDDDLYQHESDLDRFIPAGKSSFNHVHRKAQEIIMDSFLQRGVTSTDGTPLLKTQLYNLDEVNQWSKYLALKIIFSNAQNEVNDVFAIKAMDYGKLADAASQRAYLSLDTDADGTLDIQNDLVSTRLVRR